MFTFDVQEFVAFFHNHSLLPPDDSTVIPDSSTPALSNNVLSSPLANCICLSLTLKVCTSKIVWVPATVK